LETPETGSRPGVGGAWALAIGVTLVAFTVFALERMGLAWDSFDYKGDKFARIQLLDTLMWIGIVGFDLTVILAAHRRWAPEVRFAAITLLIVGTVFYVLIHPLGLFAQFR
jgi:hypothetical protein